MARVVLHGAQLGCDAERVRDALGGALVIGGERDADMTIVEDGIVWSVGLLDLVERLRDQEALQTISGHEGERGLEEVEPPKRRKLIEHQQQAMPASLRLKLLGQAPADLVEHEP